MAGREDSTSLVDVETRENRVVATDVAGNTFEVATRGWMRRDDGPTLTMRADETVSGRVTELQFDVSDLSFASLDESMTNLRESFDVGLTKLGAEYYPESSAKLEFRDGSYRIRANSTHTMLVRVEGAFTLSWRQDDEKATLTFSHPTPVTLGFRSGIEHPRATITVGSSMEDVAAALSHLSASHRTTDPELTFPTMRGHPPALELGEETEIPDGVRERSPDTGIEIVVPPSLDALLTVAPLAYYLGARVRVGDDAKLTVPEAGFEYNLDPIPTLQYQVARLLRQVFSLDAIVRSAGPWGVNVRERGVLERSQVAIDVEACYEQPLRMRVVTYLNSEFDRIADEVPPWRHWLRVPDERESLRALPQLLSDGAVVFAPTADEDAVRDATNAAHASKWELVTGQFDAANTDPWTPGYASTNAAYEHRLADVTRANDRAKVTVVVAESTAVPRANWLTDQYNHRLGDNGDVQFRQIDSRRTLAELFSASTDLLHFVGECTSAGLACPDGDLGASLLASNNVKQFILDTTTATDREDAVATARDIVNRGSISGVVARSETRTSQIDESTSETYPPFTAGNLIRYGLATETARRLVKHVHEDAELAVVGDGAYRKTSTGFGVFVHELTANGEEAELKEHALTVAPGSSIAAMGDEFALCGNPLTTTDPLDTEEFWKEVVGGPHVVVYDGDLFWPDETRRLLYPIA